MEKVQFLYSNEFDMTGLMLELDVKSKEKMIKFRTKS